MQLAAIRRILDWSPEAIQEYCRSITCGPLAEASSLGVSVEDEEWRGSHLFGLRLPPGIDTARLRPELEARSISVSLRGSAVRVAPYLYNGEEDVQALVQALRSILG